MKPKSSANTGGARPSLEITAPALMGKMPAAVYTCDAEGLITYFNQRAVELWGREPALNDPVDRY